MNKTLISPLFASVVTLAEEAPAEPRVHPTLTWLVTQMIPSAKGAWADDGLRLGLGWQVTPLLYSWGIHRGLRPWRVLIAEPLTRHAGSIEFHISPEFYPSWGDALLSPGVRAYVPWLHKGEYLSCSVGASFRHFRGESSASFEAGAYVLFGVLGLQVAWSPAPRYPVPWTFTLAFRYF